MNYRYTPPEKTPDDPKITYVSADTGVCLGHPTRLFCEAFGGRIDLPDAHSEVVWYRRFSNGTTVEVSDHIEQKKVSREDGQTFGSYLTFSEVQMQDYGTYVCIIKKPGNTIEKSVRLWISRKLPQYEDPNPFPFKDALMFSSLAVFIFIAICVLVKQYWLKICVILKDSYGEVEDNDGKTSDVVIAFTSSDSTIVTGVMVPQLEEKGYQCVTREFSSVASNWPEHLRNYSTRRIIVVLSPSALNNSWDSTNLYQTLKRLQTIEETKLLCITLQKLPSAKNEAKNASGETLHSVAKNMNILCWNRSNSEAFWLRLCKELPAKRCRGIGGGPPSRPRLNSELISLDSLMVL
ncbi:hypothetical protein ABEB36_008009 [Hypothenemus hampei]|uniref:Soluble interferon alpha/beta receptor OPG204 n=1 Tax=Hypothenemus hampei TaxID=57062 RepID=A0ABD1EKD2_HYPHA